jgi:toxin ParE1/3/4
MRRLKLSRAAESDLEEAWFYVAGESGGERADSLLEEIQARFLLLLKYPEAGRERSEFWKGLRSIVSSRYVVYYEIRPDTIDVVRVLHGARDAKAELRGGSLK